MAGRGLQRGERRACGSARAESPVPVVQNEWHVSHRVEVELVGAELMSGAVGLR